MRRVSTLSLVIALSAALVAVARAEPVVRAGVPIDSLTPAGMERVRVRAPAVAGQPVRLTFAAAGEQRAQVLVDVVVAPDAPAAREALAHWRHQLSREPAVVTGVGDVAFGTGSLIAFARDNVMISVRRVGGSSDVRALAIDADRAVASAPTGRSRARLPRLVAPAVVGESLQVPVGADLVAAEVKVSGPARARRSEDGWRVTRTGDGRVSVTMIAVDAMLRVVR